MENLGKKVGFLKGLMEGASFDTDSPNGKLMAGIVELLGDLSDRVEAIDELLERKKKTTAAKVNRNSGRIYRKAE